MAVEDPDADVEVEPVKAAFFALLLAKLAPWLIRLAAYVSIGAAVGAYGWWAWRRAKRLEAAGVEPPPAPPTPPPGPVPHTSRLQGRR